MESICTMEETRTILGIVHYVYLGIIVVVPIILIIVGMLDLAKAVAEKDENKVKSAQQLLIKKAIAAALVFLIPTLVSLIIRGILRNNEYYECWKCVTSRCSSNVSRD